MKTSISALLLGTALAFAAGGSALAQDKTVKIGVLTDNSGLYSDLGGAGSTLAAQMAVEDSGLRPKGWKIDVISADHQNKPDIATNIARQWIDVEKVDIFIDVLNSGVALGGQQPRQGEERRHDQYRRGDVGSHQRAMLAEHHSLGLRHLHARQLHRSGAGEGRRRHLVLPHRRLRLRSRAGARHHRGRRQVGRQGDRWRQASA